MRSTDWFTDARFGMFIHWGLYSNPAGVWQGRKIKHPYAEWLQASEHIPRPQYKALAREFNPDGFNADEWICEAKNAGMKYFVITSKHHDGFALWPTKVSGYNVGEATPFKQDILGALAEACRRHDIKLGLYYSHWQDWEGTGGDICSVHMENEEYVHPTEEAFQRYWQKKCLPQVRELIENYDPHLLWFDTWSKHSLKFITRERQEELISLVRQLSNKCLVNSRIQFLDPSENVDFISTMDNSFPEEGFSKPWETSGTLNHSWAYHSMDYEWRATRELIQNRVKNASLGGNYQLNVGPMGNGRFQESAIRRLREIGNWMRVHGESVYGTKASPLGKPPWGRITSRCLGNHQTRLYLHLWDFTPGTALFLEGVSSSVADAIVLETGQPIKVENGLGGIWLQIPVELNRDDLPVIRLEVRHVAVSENNT